MGKIIRNTRRGPPMVASSWYQTLMVEVIDLAMSSMERAKRTGRRGSPCCMPITDMMTSLPKINLPGLTYVKTARRNKDEVLPAHTLRIWS